MNKDYRLVRESAKEQRILALVGETDDELRLLSIRHGIGVRDLTRIGLIEKIAQKEFPNLDEVIGAW